MTHNCIILAGGKSSRLKTDKALIHFEGKTLLQKLVDIISPLTKEIIIISNDDQHNIEGTRTIKENQEKIGPLGGLKVGLQNSNTDWNLVLSVDMPLLDLPALVNQLLPLITYNGKVVIPESKKSRQYLAGFYHKSILNQVNQQIADDKFALKQLLQDSSDVTTISSNLDFSNINTQQDIEKMNLSLLKTATFGLIKEKIGFDSFDLITSSRTLKELDTSLVAHYPSLKDITYRIAVNQTFERPGYILKSSDVVALLPPFAGG